EGDGRPQAGGIIFLPCADGVAGQVEIVPWPHGAAGSGNHTRSGGVPGGTWGGSRTSGGASRGGRSMPGSGSSSGGMSFGSSGGISSGPGGSVSGGRWGGVRGGWSGGTSGTWANRSGRGS